MPPPRVVCIDPQPPAPLLIDPAVGILLLLLGRGLLELTASMSWSARRLRKELHLSGGHHTAGQPQQPPHLQIEAMRMTQLEPVHAYHDAAPQSRNDPVQGENLENIQKLHDKPAELERQRSVAGGRKRAVRIPALPPTVPPSASGEPCACENVGEIMGTPIICSGIGVSMCQNASTSWFPPCDTGASRICTKGHASFLCSTVCRCTRSCGTGSVTDPGRPPPGSSSKRLNSSGWRVRVSRIVTVKFISCPHSPALAYV